MNTKEYDEWRRVLDSTFPWVTSVVEICLSVSSLLWFSDVQLPFALVLVGRPAGWKTTALKCISEKLLNFIYYSDSFTAKAFVSHAMKRSSKQLEKIDLLPRIRDKVFITPELAPTFTQEKEKLMQSVGALTRVLDGQGYVTDSGAQGRRGYQGNYKFMWLAATTPMPYRVWEVMATLGTKMYFLRVPEPKWTRKERIQWVRSGKYKTYLAKCQKATAEFLLFLKQQTPIEWNDMGDPENVVDFVERLSTMLARLRGKVNVATRTEYNELTGQKVVVPVFTTPVIEDSTRAFIMLLNLARGHAFVRGRRQINEDDIPYLIDVAVGSAPKGRVEAFKALLKSGGTVTASQIMRLTRCSRHSALRAMQTLSILQLAQDLGETRQGAEVVIKIRKDMEWCLTNEYMQKWGVKAPTRRPIKQIAKEEMQKGLIDVLES